MTAQQNNWVESHIIVLLYGCWLHLLFENEFYQVLHNNDRCNYEDDNDNSAAMYIVKQACAATLVPGITHRAPGIANLTFRRRSDTQENWSSFPLALRLQASFLV
uniref:Uncharacterized protein n=1 Tax=Glossina austeni TaxID=7395 RepID=A0A1A9VQR6_GLOAU